MAVIESVLERELATFQKNKDILVRESSGKYALVIGDVIVGAFIRYEDALSEGYGRVGVDTPFLVRQIEADETPHCVFLGSVSEC